MSAPKLSLESVFIAGGVSRFHLYPFRQSVAAHSWGVAMILYRTVKNPSPELIKAALAHDLGEIVTGDIPAPAKWRNPELKHVMEDMEEKAIAAMGLETDLSSDELYRLKNADMLEGMRFCVRQMECGMSIAKGPFISWRQVLANRDLNDAEYQFVRELDDRWDIIKSGKAFSEDENPVLRFFDAVLGPAVSKTYADPDDEIVF